LLDRIDYTSSVSGGSWANVTLWAWPDDLGEMFRCLDKAAENGKAKAVQDNSNCKDAVKILRTHQNIELLSYPGRQRKEAWEEAIKDAHLRRGCNVYFSNALSQECAANLVTKPYFIINSTHSARSESPGADGFPVETTPDGVGTVVDEGSKRPDALPSRSQHTGFFIKFRQPNVQWMQRKFFGAHIPGGDTGLEDGSLLSLTAAHSSAVIRGRGVPAAFLTFYFQVSQNDAPFGDRRLQERYKLTDGGKSDNTGVVPLVDRGVDVLVVSYMGKEKESLPFGDLSVAKKHVRQLFGCELSDINMAPKHPKAQEAYFLCPLAPNKVQKPTLHIHPWAGNIDDFLQHLEVKAKSGDRGATEILDYLKNEQRVIRNESDRFPQTPTFKTDYDEQLIRTYYLLGKFTAQTNVAPFLRNKLSVE
jgi:hypothetical protein